MVLESNTLDVLFVKDGQQGEDGKVLYTWIKYAKDANGTGMTDDPNGAIYIGISYNNESSIESNDPTQYAWTKIQGADGKKGEDAYTIFLENENISFATDKNRNPLSEQAYTSGITIMKGAKPVTDFIIGDIAKTQGIAVAKTDTAIAISVVNGNPLPNDSGEIEIPITVGGTVFKKILTWTCAKKGDQGEQGERGLQGIQGPQGIQGVAGKDGTNGKTAYFHIKYSSVANPTSSSQLTETPSTYIGTYVDFTETDSTDPKKYTWSQFVGSQGPKGEQGIAGVGVDGKTSYLHIAYANSADGKTGFSTSDSTNKSYIGQYTDFTPNDSTDYTKYSWSLIRGKDGTDGVSPTVSVIKNGKTTTITITDKNGTHTQTVKDGTDGTPGQTGKDGKTTYFHVKYSNDGGQTFTSNSGEDVGAYIGTCTDYNQADPTTVGAYTWARIKGEKGDQGVRGEKGKDGTSVTITNKSITYQLSTSGTTIPTGTWQTSPQTIPEGQYQWTKTSVTYSDGNKTESYSISYHGKNGSNGTSVKTTSTSVKYQVGDSGTTKPTGTWQANVPTVVQGKYLWTQTIVNYSDGNSTESYSVAYRGIDGNNGVNGMNAATIYLYQRATSTPNKPSNTLTYTFSTTKITGTLNNGWSTAIPTGTDAVYVTVASVSSKNDTATIATSAWSAPVVLAQNGKTGSDGKAGLNVATIYLYQRNTSKPSKPSASITYTFSTGVASGLNNGWSQKIPDGTNPLYVTLATASSNTATDTILSSEWSDVVVMAQNGEDGQDGISPKVTLSKSGDTTTISIVDATGTHTQTVKDGTNGTPGAAGKDGKTSYFHVKYSNDGGKTFTGNSGEDTGIYMGSYTDYTEADSTDVSKYTWVKVKGDKGDTGQKGDNAKNLSITPSSQYFKSTDGGKTFAPNTITIKPTIQGEISFGKWQYSIDGGVSFTDVVSGQTGLTINNNVLTVNKDSSLYSDAVTMVTFRAVANDSSFYDTCSIAKIYDVNDIGDGRNLLWNSNFAKTDEAITGTTNSWGLHYRNSNLIPTIDTSVKHNGFNTLKAVTTVDGDKNSGNDLEWNAKGISEKTSNNLHTLATNYTLSFYAKASVSTDFVVRWGYDAYDTDTTRTLTTDWQKYEIKLHQTTSTYSISIIFKLLTAGTVWFSEFKLEKGSSATGYSTAPEDVQTAILSTKSEISDVSLKVDKNKQAIEQRVEKTTYQQDLNLVKGDISKANEGLNKWRYEIYPKSLFASEYQGKSTMDVFAKNTNLTPSQSVLINDTDFGKNWAYGDNYIGYALTFVKFSAAKSVAITFAHDDGAHIYLNGKLIGGSDAYSQTGESLTLGFVKGWNCIEVVVNEGASTEGFKLGTTISAISECQLMNCYYGTPVARQSHITNQLVENTTNIDGISTKVSKVTSVIGEGGENFTSFKNEYSDFKQTMNGFKTTVGQTYVTKDDFNGLEIGGRNLLVQKNITEGYLSTDGKGSFVGSGGGDQTSDWIDVSGNKYITITLYEDFTNTNNSGRYCEYDADKNCISTIDYNPRQKSSIIIELKSNTKYIRVTAIECKTRRYKIEKGNKATDWTPAPEDVNGKIVNATSIAQQAADKFSWIVKSGTSSSNFEITDRLMNLVSANINLDGVVSFMNTAKGDGRKNLYNLDYSSFENVASQEDAICYAKDNGVTSVGIDSSVSYDGDKSLKISYTTANLNSSTTPLYLGSSANNYGCVKIQAGKQYILSCYVKSDSTTGLFMIDIQGHDTPDTKTDGLYLSNIDPRKLPGSSTGVNLSTDWQRAVCAIKVADNATGLYWSVVPLIWGRPSSSSAPQTFNVWVDCIMLEEVDSISNEPGTYIFDKETIIDGGSIKTDTITGNQILAGSITADKIATDAIKSHNYISSGGTQGSFLNLGDGSFQSPNLSWDANGNLIAKNANLSGEITATKGSIGKYKITDQWLITGSGSTATGIGGNQAFWAGAEDSNSAPFRVSYDGKLYANGATISGDITATTGKIGDLTLKDGILTGTGSYSEPYTEDDDGTVTSTITTNYITKLFGKGLTIDSTVKYSDEDDVYSYKVSVLPDEISFTDGEEIGMLGAGGLQILQVNDNSDSYSSEANEVSLSSGASNFYYTTPVNQTTDKYLHVCFSADGASFMASQGDKFNSFDIGYSSAKYSGNFAANKFVYTGNSLNYVECLEANDTTNIYFHSNGYYSFRVNNEGNWSNETQSVYITERGISVPGQIGLYSQEMSNYVARYYIAGSTKSTAIGNNSYQTRIYGSSVWANKAVSTSDVRLKQDFQSLDKFEDLYMQLQPVSFKYIDGYDKSEDRYFGLKAQPTEKLFEDMGENPDDYAMFNKFGIDHEDIKERIGYDVDFDEEHGLDYTNLITLNTHMVQKTRRELAELQKENAELKDMLKTIVKKINM